ncbi:MAG TPA: hypothetical protein VJW77_11745 [Terriglobia bacterium]|nr:hypothetical protein [Terriglobia bacterium]
MKVWQQFDDDCKAGRRINVRIEELVLHGFAATDRHRIARAVQQELARQLRQGGVPESAGNPSAPTSIDGGAFHVPAGAAPGTIGAGIGASIYRGLQGQSQLQQSARASKPAPGGPQR